MLVDKSRQEEKFLTDGAPMTRRNLKSRSIKGLIHKWHQYGFWMKETNRRHSPPVHPTAKQAAIPNPYARDNPTVQIICPKQSR